MSISKPKRPDISHFLGIDFGESKIGLAIADSETRIAFGYGMLKNDKNLIEKIGEIIAKEKISAVVIGITKLPFRKTEKKMKTNICDRKNMFTKKLESEFGVKVKTQEEMFTTKMAEWGLKEKGAKKIKRFDDQEAARIILQSWLDKGR